MKNLDGLHPVVHEVTEILVAVCKEKGIGLTITQPYRYPAEKKAL
jgi:hypothetical protein